MIGSSDTVERMDEIVVIVERCPVFWTSCRALGRASGNGGISTQATDLRELQEHVDDAVRCHFEPGSMPKSIRYHFVSDPVLATA